MATWKVTALNVVPSLDGHNDVIRQVEWARIGKSELRGKTTLPPPGVSAVPVTPNVAVPFVAYNSLTESSVLGWVWQQVNKAAAELEPYVPATAEADDVAIYADPNAPQIGEPKPLPWSN